jgi:hypothetical protein
MYAPLCLTPLLSHCKRPFIVRIPFLRLSCVASRMVSVSVLGFRLRLGYEAGGMFKIRTNDCCFVRLSNVLEAESSWVRACKYTYWPKTRAQECCYRSFFVVRAFGLLGPQRTARDSVSIEISKATVACTE